MRIALKENSRFKITKPWCIPLIIIVSLVPMITQVHGFESELANYSWFGREVMNYDMFLYYKSLLIIVCGASAAVIIVGLSVKYKKSLVDDKRNIAPIFAILIFSIFSILSSTLANVPSDATYGGLGRFEGCYVILSYVIFFYMVFGYLRSLDAVQFILGGLVVGSVALGLIGTILAVGCDIYKLDWVKWITNIIEPYGVSREDKGSYYYISGTFENPNYVGSYVAMVLPYCVYILFRGKKIWMRVFAAISIDLLGIFLYGSQSDTGMIALGVSVFVTIILAFPDLKRKTKIISCVAGIIGIIGILIVLVSGGIVENIFVTKDNYLIKNMETIDNSIVITSYNDKHVKVTINKDEFVKTGWGNEKDLTKVITIVDEDTEKPLRIDRRTDGIGVVRDDEFPEFNIYTNVEEVYLGKVKSGNTESRVEFETDVLTISCDGRVYRFITTDMNSLYYLEDKIGTWDKLRNVDRFGFDGRYNLASGRGYIWACTIPMLKDHMILGIGQDNFVYEFPNDDYVGQKYGGFDHIFNVKPHNTYLGIWVQQGFVALLAYLFLYGLFMVRVFKLCYGKSRVKSPHSFSARGVAVTTAVATTGYMVAGLANDSNVGVTPIYWVMLGVGYAAEAICRKKADPSDDATKELPDLSEINGDEDDVLVEDTTFEEL